MCKKRCEEVVKGGLKTPPFHNTTSHLHPVVNSQPFHNFSQSSQGGLLDGYRPLIGHGKKRNTIPAEIPKSAHRWPGQDGNQPENPSARYMLLRRPPPIRKREFLRRDKSAAIFNAKVEALIECYKQIEAGTKDRIGKWKG